MVRPTLREQQILTFDSGADGLRTWLAGCATCPKAGGRSNSAADRSPVSTSSATRPGGTDDACRRLARSVSTRGSSVASSALRYQTQL